MQTLDALQFAHALTRKETAHKGDCGKVLLVGGATSMAADSMLQDGTGPIGMTPSELILYIRKILNQSLALMPAE